MIYEEFAILDTAVGAFNTPIFVRSRGQAIRSFQDACNDQKSDFNKFASDYVLYSLGTFDDSTGHHTQAREPERIVSALEVLTKDITNN